MHRDRWFLCHVLPPGGGGTLWYFGHHCCLVVSFDALSSEYVCAKVAFALKLPKPQTPRAVIAHGVRLWKHQPISLQKLGWRQRHSQDLTYPRSLGITRGRVVRATVIAIAWLLHPIS